MICSLKSETFRFRYNFFFFISMFFFLRSKNALNQKEEPRRFLCQVFIPRSLFYKGVNNENSVTASTSQNKTNKNRTQWEKSD